jgi:hypothetical protein
LRAPATSRANRRRNSGCRANSAWTTGPRHRRPGGRWGGTGNSRAVRGPRGRSRCFRPAPKALRDGSGARRRVLAVVPAADRCRRRGSRAGADMGVSYRIPGEFLLKRRAGRSWGPRTGLFRRGSEVKHWCGIRHEGTIW